MASNGKKVNYVTFSFRIPEDEYEWLRFYAQQEDRSINYLLLRGLPLLLQELERRHNERNGQSGVQGDDS
jgi:hypothetical protein